MFTARLKLWRSFANGVAKSAAAVVTASLCYNAVFVKVESPNIEYVEGVQGSQRHAPYGMAVDHRQLLHYRGHTVYYDASRKQPLWVSQTLTKENLKGSANRRSSDFRVEDKVLAKFSADNADYLKSGWSRGHMAPAGDFKYSQGAMDDTFFLTNIVPQDFDNNSGFWNRLETHCRDLVKKFDKVTIISGPLYICNKHVNGKKYVEYEVIGKNSVPVPTHLYKIVLAESYQGNNRPALACFVVPNKAIEREQDELSKYQVNLEELESLTGFTFHPGLDRRTTNNLCQMTGNQCKLTNWKEFELYFASRKIQSAKSTKDLDRIMSQLKKDGIQPSKEVLDQYAAKCKAIGGS